MANGAVLIRVFLKLTTSIELCSTAMIRLRLSLRVLPAREMNVVMLEVRKPLFLLRLMMSGEPWWVVMILLRLLVMMVIRAKVFLRC